jgi:hypothetical protein
VARSLCLSALVHSRRPAKYADAVHGADANALRAAAISIHNDNRSGSSRSSSDNNRNNPNSDPQANAYDALLRAFSSQLWDSVFWWLWGAECRTEAVAQEAMKRRAERGRRPSLRNTETTTKQSTTAVVVFQASQAVCATAVCLENGCCSVDAAWWMSASVVVAGAAGAAGAAGVAGVIDSWFSLF